MIDNKTTYAYDALKRLTNVTFDSPTPETPTATGTKSRSITLDKLDSILKFTDNESGMLTEIVGELEGKGKVLNQYSRFNGLPLEYDRNGNLSAKGSRLFTYDYKNRLIRSSRGDDAVTFTYDIFGRQTSRTDLSGTQRFFYSGDQKIEERNASGQVTRHYLWGNSIDELLRLDVFNGSSSTPYYVHTDNIGSTTAITDGSGNVVERVRYDAYGIPTFTDALGQSLKKSTIGNTTLFQGREYDYDLALYNYRARYFDPTLGRFLQTDPLGYQDSMNLYQGMGMNPVNFVDPWGEKLFINPKDKRVLTLFEYLIEMTDDDLTMDGQGEIIISHHHKKEKKLGTALISLLIKSKKNVIIYSNDQLPKNGFMQILKSGKVRRFIPSANFAMELDMRNSSNGVGTDVIVNISPYSRDNAVLRNVNNNSIAYNGKHEPIFTLVHELIHALHFVFGAKIPEEFIGRREYIKNRPKNRAYIEEFLTVGLLDSLEIEGDAGRKAENVMQDFLKPFLDVLKIDERIIYSISENAIRREQKSQYERIKY